MADWVGTVVDGRAMARGDEIREEKGPLVIGGRACITRQEPRCIQAAASCCQEGPADYSPGLACSCRPHATTSPECWHLQGPPTLRCTRPLAQCMDPPPAPAAPPFALCMARGNARPSSLQPSLSQQPSYCVSLVGNAEVTSAASGFHSRGQNGKARRGKMGHRRAARQGRGVLVVLGPAPGGGGGGGGGPPAQRG